MIKRKYYMEKIRPFINTNLVKVMTGIRRCGKSVMLELITQELLEGGVEQNQIISINFEDLQYSSLLNAESLHTEIKKLTKHTTKKTYLFFDEIQNVDGWEKCINSLRIDMDSDIYITGSNAKLLSGELATYLAGRYVEFVMYPFSFAEFLELYRQKNADIDNREAFTKYIEFGGMPYLANLNFEKDSSKQYLSDLYNSVMLKDIIQRNKVRDADLLEKVIAYLVKNTGTSFSALSISKYLKNEGRTVAPETILNYIKYSCDAFLFYQVKRQNILGKQIFVNNEKYYIADHGVRQAVFGDNTKDIQLILENIVFIEMKRRSYSVTVGKLNTNEVDFIGEKNGNLIYIQVTYLLASDDTIKREFGVFKTIQDNYPKYVVSLDDFDMSNNGVIHKNIRDFLLSTEW